MPRAEAHCSSFVCVCVCVCVCHYAEAEPGGIL